MKRILLLCLLIFFLPLLSVAQTVVLLKIEGTINPVAAAYIHRGIEKANSEKAECIVIVLNTPGGLLKSTRVIVGDLLESPVPVVVYVSPGGAHAGSAGVFITLAAHVAAMAPGTNLGAAHPVGIQGKPDTIMNDKMTNDAAAFIRSVAEKRQRNTEWAEKAVLQSLSITASEALKIKVIDLISPNTTDLLNQVHGKSITLEAGTRVLHTKGAAIKLLEMGFAEKILNIISDPTIAYILMMLGLYGLLFELYNPGAIFPGVVGVIGLILAFYSFHTLPINYAGLALIIFGIILYLLEIKIVSHGLLAIGGTVSLLLGSLMLIRTDTAPELGPISRTAIIATVAVSAFFFLGIIGIGLKAQRLRPVTGLEGMIGETGESLESLDPVGTVLIRGEIWQARITEGSIPGGEKVQVTGIDNLTLLVKLITG